MLFYLWESDVLVEHDAVQDSRLFAIFARNLLDIDSRKAGVVLRDNAYGLHISSDQRTTKLVPMEALMSASTSSSLTDVDRDGDAVNDGQCFFHYLSEARIDDGRLYVVLE